MVVLSGDGRNRGGGIFYRSLVEVGQQGLKVRQSIVLQGVRKQSTCPVPHHVGFVLQSTKAEVECLGRLTGEGDAVIDERNAALPRFRLRERLHQVRHDGRSKDLEFLPSIFRRTRSCSEQYGEFTCA